MKWRLLARSFPFWLNSLLTFSALNAAEQPPRVEQPQLTWTMLNVNRTSLQGDAHLIQFPNGRNLLIDTGYAGQTEALFEYFTEKKIKKLDWVLVTHPHRDHYEGLLDLIARKIKIQTLYFNIPDKKRCNNERPWGCDFDHITNTLDQAKKAGIRIRPIRPGMEIYSSGSIRFRILNAFTLKTSPIDPVDMNGLSVVALLESGKSRALFTGDLNGAIGGYLAKHEKALMADILKVPHHGTEAVAPDEFFDAVNPQVAMVPSPKDLWFSDRSKRIRTYFTTKSIPTFVNGLQGNVTVHFRQNEFDVCPSPIVSNANPICETFQARNSPHFKTQVKTQAPAKHLP